MKVEEIEVHPLHGLSNRVLAIASAILMGMSIDAKVAIDWQVSDSKYIGASFNSLFSVASVPGVRVVKRPRTRALPGTYKPDHCDAYYQQRDSGWHVPQTRVDGSTFFTAGGGFATGGFAGEDLEELFLSYIFAAKKCNQTHLEWASQRVPRPRLANTERDGCGSFYHAFERMRTCTNVTSEGLASREVLSEAANRIGAANPNNKGFKVGMSLWSPVVPLGDTCISSLLRVKGSVLSRVRWLPPSTLGVHVRRGNLDKSWRRSSDEEWLAETNETMARHGLRHVFVASDDELVLDLFEAHFPAGVILPRFSDPMLNDRSVAKFSTREGNVASLAEQLTLGSADVVLGTWGSTYSSLAAGWFNRPVEYMPREASEACDAQLLCPWRGYLKRQNRPSPETMKKFVSCNSTLLRLEALRRDTAIRDEIAALTGEAETQAEDSSEGVLEEVNDPNLADCDPATRRRRGSNLPC